MYHAVRDISAVNAGVMKNGTIIDFTVTAVVFLKEYFEDLGNLPGGHFRAAFIE